MNEHPNSGPTVLSRRGVLRRGVVGAAGLAVAGLFGVGCASGRGDAASRLPEPMWPDRPKTPSKPDLYARRPTPSYRSYQPTPSPALPPGVIARSSWSGGDPVPRLMDRMLPVRRITLHHDGMTAYTSQSRGDAAQRIENIRRAHRSQNWGDIGYHFVIDPAGRVWQGRPLAWQGAHVGGQNEHNLGVCVLGNYERQSPNGRQLAAIEQFISEQMDRYRIGVNEVYTHRELAPTACPGRNLQPKLVAMRSYGGALA